MGCAQAHILALPIPVKPSDYLTAPTFHLVTCPAVLTQSLRIMSSILHRGNSFHTSPCKKKKKPSLICCDLTPNHCLLCISLLLSAFFLIYFLHATKTTGMFWRTHMICQFIRTNHANSKSPACARINEAISRARAVQAVRPFLRLILSSAPRSTGIWLQL